MAGIQHKTAWDILEYLKTLGNEHDCMDLCYDFEELVKNPSRSLARDIIVQEINMWLDEYFDRFSHISKVKQIAKRLDF